MRYWLWRSLSAWHKTINSKRERETGKMPRKISFDSQRQMHIPHMHGAWIKGARARRKSHSIERVEFEHAILCVFMLNLICCENISIRHCLHFAHSIRSKKKWREVQNDWAKEKNDILPRNILLWRVIRQNVQQSLRSIIQIRMSWFRSQSISLYSVALCAFIFIPNSIGWSMQFILTTNFT